MNRTCARCEKPVYPTEELKCLDKTWHKTCFKCQTCGMALNMRTYKGFDKLPYCEAHIPKAKATTVVETPEMRRLAENTKLQSQVQYHADFEKAKGKFTQVADDPETLRIKANTKIISNVAYHGELEKKAAMEQKRSLAGMEENGHQDGQFGSGTFIRHAALPFPLRHMRSLSHNMTASTDRLRNCVDVPCYSVGNLDLEASLMKPNGQMEKSYQALKPQKVSFNFAVRPTLKESTVITGCSLFDWEGYYIKSQKSQFCKLNSQGYSRRKGGYDIPPTETPIQTLRRHSLILSDEGFESIEKECMGNERPVCDYCLLERKNVLDIVVEPRERRLLSSVLSDAVTGWPFQHILFSC